MRYIENRKQESSGTFRSLEDLYFHYFMEDPNAKKYWVSNTPFLVTSKTSNPDRVCRLSFDRNSVGTDITGVRIDTRSLSIDLVKAEVKTINVMDDEIYIYLKNGSTVIM